MKAVQFHEYGDADVLRVEDVPTPTPGAGQVRVRVAGAAFNPVDAGIRGGWVREAFPIDLPHTPGFDVSGVVDALGDGVDSLAEGDAVIAFLPMTAPGAAAEYVLASAVDLVPAPSSVPLPEAAALPSAGLTAWQALFDSAGLTAGRRVLINGAGGAVGRLAVQLAADAGATVVAVTTASQADSVSALGAVEVLDRTAGPIELSAPVDVALNLGPIDADAMQRLTALVVDGGAVVNTVPTIAVPGDPGRGVRGVGFFVRPDTRELRHLVDLVDEAVLRITVDEQVPLAGLAEVHARSDAGALRGKVVVVPAL